MPLFIGKLGQNWLQDNENLSHSKSWPIKDSTMDVVVWWLKESTQTSLVTVMRHVFSNSSCFCILYWIASLGVEPAAKYFVKFNVCVCVYFFNSWGGGTGKVLMYVLITRTLMYANISEKVHCMNYIVLCWTTIILLWHSLLFREWCIKIIMYAKFFNK